MNVQSDAEPKKVSRRRSRIAAALLMPPLLLCLASCASPPPPRPNLARIVQELEEEMYYEAIGGETLSDVSRTLYSDRAKVDALVALNPSLEPTTALKAKQRVKFDFASLELDTRRLPSPFLTTYKKDLAARVERRRAGDDQYARSETRVAKGETLQAISQRLYGTTRMWPELYLLNMEMVADYDRIEIGTSLRYFAKTSGANAKPATEPLAPAPRLANAASPETKTQAPRPAAPALAAKQNPPAKIPERQLAAAPTGRSYIVQLGAFTVEKNADAYLKTVQGKGYPAYKIEQTHPRHGKMYLVRFPPYGTRKEADAQIADLAGKDGIQAQLIIPKP